MLFNEEEQEWLLEHTRGFFKNAAMLPRPYRLGLPETIVCKDGEPKKWFVGTRDGLEFRPECFMSLSVIKNYLLFNIVLHELELEGSPFADRLRAPAKHLKRPFQVTDVERMFPIWQHLKQEGKSDSQVWQQFRSKVFVIKFKEMVKLVPSKVIVFLLLSNRNDFFRTLQKIIYLPVGSDYKVLDCSFTSPAVPRVGRRREVVLHRLKPFPVMASEQLEQDIFEQKKKEHEPSESLQFRKELGSLFQDLAVFIHNKFHHELGTLRLFFCQHARTFLLIGLSGLEIYRDGDFIEPVEPSRLISKPLERQKARACAGIYCDRIQREHIYDEADLEISLAKDPGHAANFSLLYKSILLDLVENIKTTERLTEALKALGHSQALTSQLIMKHRQFYSISDLMADPAFAQFKSSIYFKRVSVCATCQQYYRMIDWNRAKNIRPRSSVEVLIKALQANPPGSGGARPIPVEQHISAGLRAKIESIGQQQQQFKAEYQVEKQEAGHFRTTTYSSVQDGLLLNRKVIKTVNKHFAGRLGLESIASNKRKKHLTSDHLTQSGIDLCRLTESILDITAIDHKRRLARQKELASLTSPYLGAGRNGHSH